MLKNQRFFILFWAILSTMACLKIASIHSSFCDLGIFENHFYEIIKNGVWQRIIYGHIQPLMLIESLGYFFFSSSFYLVILQAFFLALPLLFLPYIAAGLNKTDHFLSVLAYLLFFGVWYNGLFDFHMDHLAVPLCFLFYLASLQKRWFLVCLAGVLTALVKEPFALQAAFCGIYLCVKYNFKERLIPFGIGIFLLCFSLFYFYIATNILSPLYTGGARGALDADAFAWMGNNLAEMILFIIFHPFQIIKEVCLAPGKVMYIILILGSFAFVPLLAPVELIPAVPVLGISLLSRLNNYYGYGHHYTAGLIAPLTVAFIVGLPKAKKIWGKVGFKAGIFSTCLIGCLFTIHILISPSPVSRLFLTDKVWSYGYNAYIPGKRDALISKLIKKYIPSDANAAVSVQNTVNVSCLAKRRYFFVFPHGVFEPVLCRDLKNSGKQHYVKADYVVLDLQRPWFIGDKGCSWIYGKCRDKEMADKFSGLVERVNRDFITLYSCDEVMILKRAGFKKIIAGK